jgi:NAD(P)-dependent dehydrogenase (short-subunit alcohol dehydrogenase family)
MAALQFIYFSWLIVKMQKRNVAIVTGSSSGIGHETALLLARSGYHTYASMRNLEKSKDIVETAKAENLPLETVMLDVNDDRSVKGAIDKIVSENNGIDVLVNNAGYGLFGSLEDLSIEEIKSQFETNFFGVIRVTQNVLPFMRKQGNGGGGGGGGSGGGTIVNVSSVGGRVGVPVLSAYQSTKFALEGLSESISYELAPFGIRVVIIEPGFIRTNIMNSSVWAKRALDSSSPYYSMTQKVGNHFKSMIGNPSSCSPYEVANVILQAIHSKSPNLRYTVGSDAAQALQAKNSMSDAEFGKLLMQQFQ